VDIQPPSNHIVGHSENEMHVLQNENEVLEEERRILKAELDEAMTNEMVMKAEMKQAATEIMISRSIFMLQKGIFILCIGSFATYRLYQHWEFSRAAVPVYTAPCSSRNRAGNYGPGLGCAPSPYLYHRP
jgi:hypothetical protein